MDIRINEVHSRIHATDSRSLLDPRILQEIVYVCVTAVKEELARDKRIAEESRLSASVQTDEP